MCCKGIGLGLQKLSLHATHVSKELAGIEPRTLEILYGEVSTLPTELFDPLEKSILIKVLLVCVCVCQTLFFG